ncbi:MAG: DNA-binding protein [Planctomycetota bacterium]|nr:MAG: DNA-binding protein [Planctomycetota bacterium]
MGVEHDRVLTIGELSEYLKISKSTLYKLAQEGNLPGQKVGKHWRFHREVIDRWLASRSEEIKNDGQEESKQETQE